MSVTVSGAAIVLVTAQFQSACTCLTDAQSRSFPNLNICYLMQNVLKIKTQIRILKAHVFLWDILCLPLLDLKDYKPPADIKKC